MTHRLREVALWTGAALGLASVIAGTAVMFFGYTFLIFRSGSMGPDIPTGSIALARTTPVAELETGDVVSVVAANGARVTHRLVSATVREDGGSLILQGDTNTTPDAEIYQVTEAERAIASLPYVGYAVTVLLSPAGLLAAGCLGGMMVLLGFGAHDERPSGRSSRRPGPGRHRGARRAPRRSVAAAAAGISMIAAATAAGGVAGTSAYFTDRATVSSGTFTAGSVSPAGNVRCIDNGNQDYITWNAPSGVAPTGYRVFWSASNGESGQADFTSIQQYQPPVVAFFNVTYSVTVVAVRGSWSSATSNAGTIRAFTFFGTSWSC